MVAISRITRGNPNTQPIRNCERRFGWLMRTQLPVVVVLVLYALTVPLAAQSRTGAEVYRQACVACHGIDGRGQPQSVVGFDTPLPDFAECSFASREPAADWFAITHSGGPVRSFDRMMPAFGQALEEPEIERAIEFVKTFCPDDAWPRGELNLPRALVTEKAYPEDEAVLTLSASGGDEQAVRSDFLYERRFGARSQFEVKVPIDAQEASDGWQRGLGDVAVAVKHALFHSSSSGSIFSVVGEVVLPTGKETDGLGRGYTVFEPFVAFGQILPADAFLQAQVGVEFPTDTEAAANEGFWRVVLGKSFTQNRFGRTWSPMVELLGAKEFAGGESTHWDVVPQVQVTLSRRQHVMLNAGVRLPVTEREGRHGQFITYLLWDWFDGGFFDGWR